MLQKLILSAAIITVGATGAVAQSLTGAELGIEYTDSPDIEDLGGVSYYGSAEVGIGYGLSAAVDFSAFNYDVGDSDVSNLTAHFIYNVDPATAVGLFIGQDSAGDADSDILGAEVAYDFGIGRIDGYIGSATDSIGDDASIYGAAATYEIGQGFFFEGGFDALSGDGFSANATEIGAFYQLPQGPKFGAAIGRLGAEADGLDDVSENYFSLKASVAIGSNGETTFGRRGVFQVLQTGPAD